VKPPAPLAADFKETAAWKEGDGWKIAKPDDAQLRGKWWELYGDPTLNELEEQVDPSNQSLTMTPGFLADKLATLLASHTLAGAYCYSSWRTSSLYRSCGTGDIGERSRAILWVI
jgi:hypothetical protein